MSHYEERLQRDLDNIKGRVEALAKDAERAVSNSLEAVKTGNTALSYRTILEDGRINRAHTELNKQCYRFIALHLPSAGPLRLIESIVRTNIQLERLGDYAVTISREAVQISNPPKGTLARQLELISADVLLMLRQAVTSFTESNEEMARATMPMAGNIEPTMDAVYSDLINETDPTQIKDALAIFVIFNMVKRVSDQAKNICEEALFAISGEYKLAKRHHILFVDEEGSRLAPMAAAIAHKLYPDSGFYAHTNRRSSGAVDDDVSAFMEHHGYDLSKVELRPFDSTPENISRYFVIVSLKGPVATYFPKLPFHTSALEWDIEGSNTASDDPHLEEAYRGIVANVSDLMEMLTGEGAV